MEYVEVRGAVSAGLRHVRHHEGVLLCESGDARSCWFTNKFHLTHAAHLWLLSSMDTEMFLKVRTLTKLLMAQLTLKGLVSSMDTEMYP